MDERPTTKDLLERDEFIKRLGKALVAPDNSRATGVVVGITGEWGSGKSSILKMAATHLKEDRKAIVIPFDPWIISGRDDLIERLLIQIATRLGLRKEKWAKSLSKKVAGYVETLGPAVDALKLAADIAAPGAGKAAGAVAKIIGGELGKKLDIHQQREELKEALEKAQVAIIVMIDEIDRLDDGEIRSVAQFVRAVADFERISYLLAYDQKRVAEALGGGTTNKHRARGSAYLEKIVQHQIPLPILVKEQLLRLFDKFTSPHLPEGWASDRRWPQLAGLLFPDVLGTPRDIKRLGGAVQVQAMLGEIDPVDLVGWCALQVKCPQAVDVIRDDPTLVGGPDRGRLTHDSERFVTRQTTGLVELFDEKFKTSREISNLLDFLFPTRRPHGSTAGLHPDCLGFDRPLMTVLRQGIPQGYFSRSDIDAFLTADRATRCEILAKAMEDNLFTPFYTRLAEIYPAVQGLDHVRLWSDIAAFLTEAAIPWPNQPTPYHGLQRQLYETMVHTGMRRHHEAILPGLHDACRVLASDGDWQILPRLLDDQIWHWGLFRLSKSEYRPRFLSEEETKAAVDALVQRLRTEFLGGGDIIGRLRSLDALLIATLSGGWTAECKEELTRQLTHPPVLDALVLLLFRGGMMPDHGVLQSIMDFDIYLAQVRRRVEGGLDESPSSLKAVYMDIKDTGLPPP